MLRQGRSASAAVILRAMSGSVSLLTRLQPTLFSCLPSRGKDEDEEGPLLLFEAAFCDSFPVRSVPMLSARGACWEAPWGANPGNNGAGGVV